MLQSVYAGKVKRKKLRFLQVKRAIRIKLENIFKFLMQRRCQAIKVEKDCTEDDSDISSTQSLRLQKNKLPIITITFGNIELQASLRSWKCKVQYQLGHGLMLPVTSNEQGIQPNDKQWANHFSRWSLAAFSCSRFFNVLGGKTNGDFIFPWWL